MDDREETELSYCARQVRGRDPDRYLCTLFAPAGAREGLFALYAFDHEIARVRHVVSEAMPGLIRLQWWRDALDGLEAGRPPAQPVALALHEIWPTLRAQREHLDAAIDARERELEEAPFADLADLERHLEATSAGIARAALGLLEVDDATTLAAGRHAALAWGLASLLRSIARDAKDHRVLLPSAHLAHEAASIETVLGQKSDPALARVVAQLAALGESHLQAARKAHRKVPRTALAAVLPGSLAGDYFRRLERAGHDPFAAAAQQRDPLAPLRLAWRAWRARI